MAGAASIYTEQKWWALVQNGVVVKKFLINAGIVEDIVSSEAVDVTSKVGEVEVGDLYANGIFTKP